MFNKLKIGKIAEELGHLTERAVNKAFDVAEDPKTQAAIEELTRGTLKVTEQVAQQIAKGVERARQEHLQGIAPSTVPWKDVHKAAEEQKQRAAQDMQDIVGKLQQHVENDTGLSASDKEELDARAEAIQKLLSSFMSGSIDARKDINAEVFDDAGINRLAEEFDLEIDKITKPTVTIRQTVAIAPNIIKAAAEAAHSTPPKKSQLQKLLEAKNAKNSVTPYFHQLSKTNKKDVFKAPQTKSQSQAKPRLRRHQTMGMHRS